MGLIVYVRNLVLIRRVRKADKIAAAQAAAAEAAEVDAVHHRPGGSAAE
jgi:hypothetical protein